VSRSKVIPRIRNVLCLFFPANLRKMRIDVINVHQSILVECEPRFCF